MDSIADKDKATDIVRWVDTDVMICDPLTKIMEPIKLTTALDSNEWNIAQPIESLMKKRVEQAQRRSQAPEEPALEEPQPQKEGKGNSKGKRPSYM